MLPRQRASRIARLQEIIREKSFRIDNAFIGLKSKAISNVYFDMKPTMLDAEGGQLLGELMYDVVGDNPPDFVSGPAVGAVALIHPFTRAARENGFKVFGTYVDKPKDHGMEFAIQGPQRGQTLQGLRGVVLEDVTTTGDSAMKAVVALQEAGATVIHVIGAVTRDEGAAELFQKAGLAHTALTHKRDYLTAEQEKFYPKGSPEALAWWARKEEADRLKRESQHSR